MKKKIIGIVLLVAFACILLAVYYSFREMPENPNMGPSNGAGIDYAGKNVVIEVIDDNAGSTLYKLTTHADFLEDVMKEADNLTYDTTDGMVMVVNGLRADYVLDGAYWAFYVNDGYCNYGIADQPVNNGDKFRIEYTKA